MQTVVELASIYAVAALGVLLTSIVIEFFDLTVDGSFTLGGATSAVTLLWGWHPLGALAAAALAGLTAGSVTALLWRLKIQPLLCGILVMFALYSINLHLMGSSNISLLHLTLTLQRHSLWLLLIFALLVAAFVYSILVAPIGAAMRAAPRSTPFLQSVGIAPSVPIVSALLLSNAIVASAGAAMAQLQGYADVSMGDGSLVYSLAAIILGRAMLKNRRRPAALIAATLFGAFAYQSVLYLALRAGLPPVELRVLTSALIVTVLLTPRFAEALPVRR